MANLFTILKMLIFLGIVLYLLSLFMKFLNRYTFQTKQGIQIIQKIGVTKNSAIGIIKIVNTYYVMSFSETQNQIIKELTQEEVKQLLVDWQENPQAIDPTDDFKKIVQISKERLAKLRSKK